MRNNFLKTHYVAQMTCSASFKPVFACKHQTGVTWVVAEIAVKNHQRVINTRFDLRRPGPTNKLY